MPSLEERQAIVATIDLAHVRKAVVKVLDDVDHTWAVTDFKSGWDRTYVVASGTMWIIRGLSPTMSRAGTGRTWSALGPTRSLSTSDQTGCGIAKQKKTSKVDGDAIR